MRSCVFVILLTCMSVFCRAEETASSPAQKPSGRNISVTLPEYPSDALAKGIFGRVLFEFGLNEKGLPKNIAIVESVPVGVFDDNVLRAVTSWQYLPNMDDACGFDKDRFRQQLWFEIQNGEPRITMSKVLDLSRIQPFGRLDPENIENRAVIATEKDDDRFILLDNSGLRIKERTLKTPAYPREAERKGVQGLVIVHFHVLPDGSVSDISIAYSAPDGVFDEAVKTTAMKYKFERLSGQPPGRKITLCMPFSFRLSE